MWQVITRMYEAFGSAVLLDGEMSASFSVEQGVAQGCSLSPILFSVFSNDLLKEVEKTELGIHLGEGGRIGGMLFADDFVGVGNSKEQLQKLIDSVCVCVYNNYEYGDGFARRCLEVGKA